MLDRIRACARLLQKMALDDLRPGKARSVRGTPPTLASQKPETLRQVDYTGTLPDELRGRFTMHVRHQTGTGRRWVEAIVREAGSHSSVPPAAVVTGLLDGGKLHLWTANARVRRLGLGQHAYAALYAHAKRLGAAEVVGDRHSADAHRAQAAVARQHGLAYEARPDDRLRDMYGPYRFALK